MNALDAQTERETLDTLSSVVRPCTTISITHRFSLAALAFTIYVLSWKSKSGEYLSDYHMCPATSRSGAITGLHGSRITSVTWH
jgi:hypothetical protein